MTGKPERRLASGETRTLQATETAEGHLLRLARVFEAPRGRVWAAWTEPDKLRRWWGPETFDVPHCEIDLRPGGAWRTCMREPDGREHWVGGVYREIVAPERLAFTWAWESHGGAPASAADAAETLVAVELRDAGPGRTEVVLTHARFPTAKGREGHGEGWTSSLDDLERHLGEGD